MENTKKLLSITNLKKYFPVAKTSIFQRKQLYVRANEDITLDIYEGETLGIVGESGCGKSTLGRVLLQLYPQTAGCTLYYGTRLDRLTPEYVIDTIRNDEKYRGKLKRSIAKAEELAKKVEEAGGEDSADFYLLQDANIARCEMETDLSNLVKIIGGFYVHDDKEGMKLLADIYEEHKKQNAVFDEQTAAQLESDSYADILAEGQGNKAEKAKSKKAAADAKVMELQKKIDEYDQKINGLEEKLAAVRAKYANDEEFQHYEALRDDGIDLARLKYGEMRKLRKDLQIIFQDPYSSLNPRFTVGQIIEEGLTTHNMYRHGSTKLREHIVKTMEESGLQEYMLHRYPHQFSGGQRQRICIARALAVQPKFIVCDECVSALDVSIQSQIINLLQELQDKQHLTYMFISHDLSVVKFISDRIAVMYLGNIVELADKKALFDDPRHPYTIALLSSIPTTDPGSKDKERIVLEGNVPSPVNPPPGCKFCTRCYMATEKCRRVTPQLVEVEPNHFLACHFPEKKLGPNKEYLFEVKTTRNTPQAEEVAEKLEEAAQEAVEAVKEKAEA
ncbi:MAG: ATP-binding cassette domain-containing protein [Lachnospiraceae bacterium]|nr:ATP-binding cassette domain-containing protein [Lachnospiraceae bacterium]